MTYTKTVIALRARSQQEIHDSQHASLPLWAPDPGDRVSTVYLGDGEPRGTVREHKGKREKKNGHVVAVFDSSEVLAWLDKGAPGADWG